ncbi:hypothetical protein GCM10028791_22690 [Echinicola sediminis]
MTKPYNVNLILISLGLLSAAIIAFQLVLMQILSITQWHHFAYMVISVALLGFGAAGTFLSLFRQWLLQRFQIVIPALMLISGGCMATVIGISQATFLRFDSYLLFADYSHLGKLIITYLLFFLPFFFGALSIGMVFTQYIHRIGKVYFANLFGSGLGGMMILLLIPHFRPETLPALVSLLTLIAGTMLIKKKQYSLMATSAATFLLMMAFIIRSIPLHLSQFKSISHTLLLPKAQIEQEQNSPQGWVQVVSSPVLRFGPGLSLSASQAPKIQQVVFVNGDWFGPYVDFDSEDFANVLDHTTMALPFVMQKREKVLILNAGTGFQVPQAIQNGAGEIWLAEPNKVMVSMLGEQLGEGRVNPAIVLHQFDGRTYIASSTKDYQLIQLPISGAFGGTNGLNATMEQYLLTVQGFSEMFDRLTAEGVISITCWIDYPLRNPLKMLATVCQMLENQGIQDISAHIAAVRSWGTVTYAVKKTPLTPEEADSIRSFCKEMLFDPLILPGISMGERMEYNQLQDSSLLNYVDQILVGNRSGLYKEYDFNIRPPTDNKPYFSQFLQWKSLNHLSSLFGDRSLPFLEVGYLLIVITLVQIALLAFVLILLPLLKLGLKGGGQLWMLFYFSGIGLGYMFVEMVLIQRLTLYFGHPVYAASASISAILIFSGIGSYLSGKWHFGQQILQKALLIIILLIAAYAVFLPSILSITMSLSLFTKVILVGALVAPLAVCMGLPFPLGLSLVSKKNESLIPWAWAVNGCLSVISTALATIVAIELGFVWVMVVAGLGYAVTLGVSFTANIGRKD